MAKIDLFFLFQRQVCGSIRVPSGRSDYRFQFAGAPHAVPVKSKKKLVGKKMSFSILIDKETYLPYVLGWFSKKPEFGVKMGKNNGTKDCRRCGQLSTYKSPPTHFEKSTVYSKSTRRKELT